LATSFAKANSCSFPATNRIWTSLVLTTLANYRLISRDIDRSVATAAKDATVARATDYYLANIGKVKTVDDFLSNDKLFKYAMKAYGLEDMAYAKAFMRKVLESDLNDRSSFVNKLSDKRYLEFAKAFRFMPDGGLAIGPTAAQDAASEDAMIGLYSQQRIIKGQSAQEQAAYYQSHIGNITSVDQLLADPRLFDFALKAHGLDPSVASVSAIRNVLTSDLGDPSSVANVYGGKYKNLAASFSFAPDGSVVGGSAQTSLQANETMLAYYEATDTDASPAAATFKVSYFAQAIASVTNVDDLVSDEFLRSFVAVAAGLDPILTTAATVREILVSDLSDPDSAANKSNALKSVAQAFNFNTDGSLDSGVAAQDANQSQALNALYNQFYDDGAIRKEGENSDYYRSAIAKVTNVDGLLSDARLYKFMLTSYGIDPNEVSKLQVKRILLSDPTSASSYTRLRQDSRFTALAGAFNFDSDGNAQGARQVQTAAGAKNTIARYTATLGELKHEQARGKTETQYFDTTILSVTSVDDLLKNTRLRSYIVRAYDLEKNIPDATLRKVLTSDKIDERSFANKSGNAAFKALAADFNFNSDGSAGRAAVAVAQDNSSIATTRSFYYRQKVEEDAGSKNEGVRLALYFERKAPGISSAYSILADKALLKVAQTLYGLPESMSLLDIDKQAKMLDKVMNLEDFQDSQKVQKMLTRFSAKWDAANSTAAQSNPAVALLQPIEAGVSYSLLNSLQRLKLGGA